PNRADADGDGLSDGAEVNSHGTDPNRGDSDGDGLSDRAEINTHGTDALNPDTDGDGLADGDEILLGTDPLDPDTDGDGLTDADEVNAHGTDPQDPDSDNDGFDDGDEIADGTRPNNADSHKQPASLFADDDTSIFEDDILWLAEQAITLGCGANSFCPDDSVTRGQMAAFLNRALELPATSVDFFTDDNGSVFEADINRLAAAGITAGCGANSYCVNDSVTRGQMAAFLNRALELPATSVDFFTDDSGSVFEADINRLAAAGITAGCGGSSFCPNNSVTRGQMAAFLRRALS
ncbi:MAG: S-layer homology domain-containing protein, partial [Acidimicrobiia bacterium]|nr:S-layer homology domain-containing protein [Acidimicrobiia bacterium]